MIRGPIRDAIRAAAKRELEGIFNTDTAEQLAASISDAACDAVISILQGVFSVAGTSASGGVTRTRRKSKTRQRATNQAKVAGPKDAAKQGASEEAEEESSEDAVGQAADAAAAVETSPIDRAFVRRSSATA